MRQLTIIPGYLVVGIGECVDREMVGRGATISGLVTERIGSESAFAIVVVGYGIAIVFDSSGEL